MPDRWTLTWNGLSSNELSLNELTFNRQSAIEINTNGHISSELSLIGITKNGKYFKWTYV